MAAAALGIFNRELAAGQTSATKSATPMGTAAANASSGSSGTSSSTNTSTTSASVSANDFLVLLVTEMKNQDPTANTDPNQYINQLVQVNSLEQLISINQTLSAKSTTTTGSTTTKAQSVEAIAPQVTPGIAGTGSSMVAVKQSIIAPGNLSVPASSPAAQGVARALGVR